MRGEAYLHWACPSLLPVRPHTRGEVVSTHAPARRATGSPPHAWGHFHRGFLLGLGYRFTPTRVGTLLSRKTVRSGWPVHPHTRGDIVSRASSAVTSCGSPPHAWGHSAQAEAGRADRRFTPTRVGTLCGSWVLPPHNAVHPHTRGDIATSSAAQSWMAGSPPHAWGHWLIQLHRIALRRFTPTRVRTFGRGTRRVLC